ncbi:GTP cyclohydrolase 1 [Gregarina niphandrodes]|uniref:GTP cyclohydrolase 1 n=1 Tax=Gregarina niphandrodes TaxID=110365 RepID=A0A023BDA6_GRENI|nr:GTP cyclohydrolase 1 [Gregarina niphandrodes]EZG88165.1 GTP cyclohydrolase 1 [Gregarina niphandrodes]|eukprot:XP_011128589.1 GTP cyclohydrolase 1 [Gregarina niphandrodes]
MARKKSNKTNKSAIKVARRLLERGLEHTCRHTPLHTTRSRLCRIEWHLRKVLETLGYNKGDEVYQRTPKRVAKAYILELFSGLDYGRFPRCSKFPIIIGINTRRRIRDIPFTSMCEHHLLPFTGTITIGYKPRKYVIGLSKIPRVAQFFACRPQMQERLTCQILEALRAITHSKEAGIKIDAQHTCVCARGIKSDNVTTTYQLKHLSPNGLAMLFDK